MKLQTLIAVIFATLALAVGYGTNGYWFYFAIIIAFGSLWGTGIWKSYRWTASPGLVVFVGAAAYGIHLNISPLWMLVATIATLISWDLARFEERLSVTPPSEATAHLQRIHMQRLALISGLGLLLSILTLVIQVDLTLGWAVLLGLLMVVSLSWVIRRVKRANVD